MIYPLQDIEHIRRRFNVPYPILHLHGMEQLHIPTSIIKHWVVSNLQIEKIEHI